MTNGVANGVAMERFPGFNAVQVAAVPPPVEPSTTLQVAGIPEAKSSFRRFVSPRPGNTVKETLPVRMLLLAVAAT